jgi:DNA/RNA-binding domain of Phe-tRNA-synthetase-like protein
MPGTSEKMNEQLGVKAGKLSDCKFGPWKGSVKKGEHLFEKVELKKEEEKARDISVAVTPEAGKLGIKVRAAKITGVKVKKKQSSLEKLKKEAVEATDLDSINKSKEIEGYRKLYEKVGAEADHPVASLAGIIKKAGKLPTINTVVDSYNVVALARRLSVGAHDLDKIQGNVSIKITDGKEAWTPLGQDSPQKVPKGEYACVDEEKVLCRMDIKQGDQSKITDKTRNIFVYVQGNPNTPDKYLEDALKEIVTNITRFCGGKAELL